MTYMLAVDVWRGTSEEKKGDEWWVSGKGFMLGLRVQRWIRVMGGKRERYQKTSFFIFSVGKSFPHIS